MKRHGKLTRKIGVIVLTLIFLSLLTHFVTYVVFPERFISRDVNTFIRKNKASQIQAVTQDKVMTNYLLKYRTEGIEKASDAVPYGRKQNLIYMVGAFHKIHTDIYVRLDQGWTNFLVPKFKIVQIRVLNP